MTLHSSPEGFTRHERAAEIEPTLDSSFNILTANYAMACLCWNPFIVTNQRWSFLANQKWHLTCARPALGAGFFVFARFSRAWHGLRFSEWYDLFLFDQNIHDTFTHTWTRPCQNTRRTLTLMVGWRTCGSRGCLLMLRKDELCLVYAR